MSGRPGVTLSLSQDHHALLEDHLFSEDGCEGVAVALCGRRVGSTTHRLLVREVHPFPHEQCDARSPVRVTWRSDFLVSLLERAEAEGLALVKVHSHRTDYREFSRTDDQADHELFPCVAGWTGSAFPHASVVMLPDGAMFGRAFWPGFGWMPLRQIGVVGPDLRFWPGDAARAWQGLQAFGEGTTRLMRSLTIGVVGCSGTGSVVIEQLARLGAGRLVLVDDDRLAERNLGRVLSSAPEDAEAERPKVELLAAAIERQTPTTVVHTVFDNLWSRDAVDAVAECDVVFGCMDSHEGRFLLNLLATDYLIPYFDLGVRLDATGAKVPGGVREACGTVHYLLPGRSSLMSRGLVSLDRVREDGLRRKDALAYRQQVADGYILGMEEQRPAVISVNMFAASLAVNDLLARLHPFREEPNGHVASIEFSLASMELLCEPEAKDCPFLLGRVGRGDTEPRLDLTELSLGPGTP
jgi:hypothetical protein